MLCLLCHAPQDGSHFNKRWGYLSRAGLNDKSQLCRQIEKYADIYTSRVSNFLRCGCQLSVWVGSCPVKVPDPCCAALVTCGCAVVNWHVSSSSLLSSA